MSIAISVAGCQRPASAEEHVHKEVPEGFVPLFDPPVLVLPYEVYFHPGNKRAGVPEKYKSEWPKHMIWPEVLFPAKLLYEDPLVPHVKNADPDRESEH